MAVDQELVKKLVAVIGRELGASTNRPNLRVVGGTDTQDEAAEARQALLARIRDFARMYWLAWLVRQETAHAGKVLEDFTDDELGELMRKMEKGRDCRNDDVSFDDAGLVRGSLDQALGY